MKTVWKNLNGFCHEAHEGIIVVNHRGTESTEVLERRILLEKANKIKSL